MWAGFCTWNVIFSENRGKVRDPRPWQGAQALLGAVGQIHLIQCQLMWSVLH